MTIKFRVSDQNRLTGGISHRKLRKPVNIIQQWITTQELLDGVFGYSYTS